MKMLSKLTNIFSQIMIDENLLYDGVIHNGSYIEKKIKGCDFQCPRCQKNVGFECYDPLTDKKYVSCIQEDCLKFNAGKSIPKKCFVKLTMQQCGVDEDYVNSNMNECIQPKDVLNELIQMANKPTKFLTLSGIPGSGKTYAACSALNEYLNHGINGFFIKFSEIYQQYKEILQDEGTDVHLLRKLQEKELLVIDEMGLKKPTESFLDFIYLLLDKRYSNPKLGTIITTNFNSKQFEHDFGSAITSRITASKCFRLFDEDRRKKEWVANGKC